MSDKVCLDAVLRSCLDARYSFFRDNYREPRRFRISSEAHAAIREHLKKQAAPRFVEAERKLHGRAVVEDGSLLLHGVPTEVDLDLVGAEARAE